MPTYRSSSSEETKKFAAGLAKKIISAGPQKSGAVVLALKGDLGAGKTTFVQGFFKGLRLKRVPASPTFILMRRTALKNKAFKNVYHLDAYRLRDEKGASALELPEVFGNPENIVLIEWPERIKRMLPSGVINLSFAHGKTAEQRTISVRGV